MDLIYSDLFLLAYHLSGIHPLFFQDIDIEKTENESLSMHSCNTIALPVFVRLLRRWMGNTLEIMSSQGKEFI